VSELPIIRPVVPESSDLAAVTAIMAHYVEHTVATFTEIPPSAEEWAQRHAELTALGLPFLVAETGGAETGGAETGGEVVGFAYAAPWRPKSAYRYTVENTVYLAPGVTGRGIGAALLTELIDRAAAAGCHQMIAVIADTGSPASARLHRRLGFVDAGRLHAVGFKLGRWIDTQLMQRDLTASP
jgi:phosphinothricin acetyltransferase